MTSNAAEQPHEYEDAGSLRRVPSAGSRLGRGFVRLVREPVILILVLAGVVDVLSGSPWSHGALLVAVAFSLGLDRIRRRRAGEVSDSAASGDVAAGATAHEELALARRPGRRPRFAPLTIVGGTVYAAIVGSFARVSWPATIAVLVPGIAAVAASWHDPVDPRPEPARIEPAGALAWAALFIVLGLWELTNLLLQPSLLVGSAAHPTISVLTDPLLASHLGRSVFVCSWLALGMFLLER